MSTVKHQEKNYNASEVIVFRKTKEAFGGLSNMASGFPLEVNGVHILTSEAIYQACRFPHLPHVQEKIILERSPMSAKMVSKPFREDSREDWDDVRINIMRWSLRVKLAQNFVEFGKLLETTQNKPIVEDSHKDNFWGAIRDKNGEEILRGVNALGRLLMELRQNYNDWRYTAKLFYVEPLKIPNFKLYGEHIGVVDEREKFIEFLGKQFGISTKNQVVYNSPIIREVTVLNGNTPYIQPNENVLSVASEPITGINTPKAKGSKTNGTKSPKAKAASLKAASLFEQK